MRTLLALLFGCVCLQGHASDKGTLTFHLDNDLFANTDQDYTNGARVSYITGGRKPSDFNEIEKWLDSVQEKAPQIITGLNSPNATEYNYGVSLTQLMFTPEDLEPLTAPPGQHPYVGWLGFGFSLHAKDTNAINSIELSLGTTGKNAIAETTQDFIHDLRNFAKFNGWDSQMPTEPTLNFFFTQKRRLFADVPSDNVVGIDGFNELEFALGNFRTSMSVGFVTRAGFNLPGDFSDPRIGPTSYSHDLFNEQRIETSQWSAYSIVGARGNAVLHDISLDGPLTRDFDMGIEKKDFVGEVYLGGAIRYSRWELSYVHTFRSKEFVEQPRGAQFGSVALRCQF